MWGDLLKVAGGPAMTRMGLHPHLSLAVNPPVRVQNRIRQLEIDITSVETIDMVVTDDEGDLRQDPPTS